MAQQLHLQEPANFIAQLAACISSSSHVMSIDDISPTETFKSAAACYEPTPMMVRTFAPSVVAAQAFVGGVNKKVIKAAAAVPPRPQTPLRGAVGTFSAAASTIFDSSDILVGVRTSSKTNGLRASAAVTAVATPSSGIDVLIKSAAARSQRRLAVLDRAYLVKSDSAVAKRSPVFPRKSLPKAVVSTELKPSARKSSPSASPASASAVPSPPVDPHKVDKPKRPLSAYNLFFQHERARLLLLADKGERLEDHPPVGLTLCGVRDLLRGVPNDAKEADVAAGYAEGAGGNVSANNKAAKKHGKVGFTDLVKHMALSWRKVDRPIRSIFEEISEDDKARYRREMRAYRVKLNAVKSLKRKMGSTKDKPLTYSDDDGQTYATLEERLRAQKRARLQAEAESKKAVAGPACDETRAPHTVAKHVETILRKKSASRRP